MNYTRLGFSLFSILLISLSLSGQANSQTVATAPAPAKTEKQWQQWYVYSLNSIPKGIYREEFHLDPADGSAVVYHKITERDDTQMKETTVVSTAMNDIKFTPVRFYVKQKYIVTKRLMSRYFIFEGVEDSGNVGIRIHDSEVDGDPAQILLPSNGGKYIFGAFLPMFLNKLREANKITIAQNNVFQILLEEGESSKFRFSEVSVKLGDKIVAYDNDHCHVYRVEFDKIPSKWYVSEKGKLCRMEIPKHGVNLKMVSEQKAKSYL